MEQMHRNPSTIERFQLFIRIFNFLFYGHLSLSFLGIIFIAFCTFFFKKIVQLILIIDKYLNYFLFIYVANINYSLITFFLQY